MPKRILIVIPGHLAKAPRVQKEAAAAQDAGFEVFVRGAWFDEDLAKEDTELAAFLNINFAPVSDFRPSQPGRSLIRLKHRFAKELFDRVGIVSPRSFGYGGPELLKEALRIVPDLTMGHSEVGMWVAHQLLLRGKCVGIDFEDWFSEDLPESDRKGRPVKRLRWLERELLRNAPLTITTTQVMAEAMAADAGTMRIPLVIPNCFPWSLAPICDSPKGDQRSPDALSLYWFSQTIGPGRGLETVAKALAGVTGKWELHLRGQIHGHAPWLDATFPSERRQNVIIHPLAKNLDLPELSSTHDIGLALENTHPPSRNLTATNKIFEYLRYGQAVIATTTDGQMEILNSCPESGWSVPPGNVEALRNLIQSCIDDRAKVAKAKKAARHAAEHIWAWEPFAGRLGAAFHSILSSD